MVRNIFAIFLAAALLGCGSKQKTLQTVSSNPAATGSVEPFAPPVLKKTQRPKKRGVTMNAGSESKTKKAEKTPLKTAEPTIREPVSIRITFGGDISLNRTGEEPHAEGTGTGRNLTPWRDFVGGIVPVIDGAELNFGNLETVVTSRGLMRTSKKYTFQSHADGVEYLVKAGFNLFSLANNHAFDFGEAGARSTLKELKRLKEKYPEVNFAGLGVGEEAAAQPVVFEVKGKRIVFAAVGIITNMNLSHRTGPEKAGTLRFRDDADYKIVLDSLRKAEGDYKILSVHYGKERDVKVDPFQRKRFERAFEEAGVDLILGHHAHVVRGVERRGDGRLAFYGLGNYMMRGARNMGPLPDAQDYGLFGDLELFENVRTGRLEPRRLVLRPLTDMHWNAKPLKGHKAERRLEVLNGLSKQAFGDTALTVMVRHGVGTACLPSSDPLNDKHDCKPLQTSNR